jgi:hypothetical protein
MLQDRLVSPALKQQKQIFALTFHPEIPRLRTDGAVFTGARRCFVT